jgi:hypothetical protein
VTLIILVVKDKNGKKQMIAKYSAAKTLTGALFVWFTLRSKATSGKVLVFSSYNERAKHKSVKNVQNNNITHHNTNAIKIK